MGSKRVTSRDVASLAGVSRTTVSVVLNNAPGINISPATRQRVIDAANHLGYVPDAAAQALVSGRARIIGLILARRSYHISSDAFIPQILEGLLDTIHQHDLRLLVDIVDPEHQEQAYLHLVRANRIDGILLSGPLTDDLALRVLQKEGFPTVIIGQIPEADLWSVDIDNCAAARTATTHLIRLGHTRIAFVSNAPPMYAAAADRLRGYRQALESYSIAFDPSLVRYGDFTMDSGYQQMCSLLDGESRFTAAFIASDTLAVGAKAAILERNFRVPEDIALVGFDDLPFARYTEPALTTIRLPVTELASYASNLLIRIMNGERPEKTGITLDVELVVRDSCGARVLSTH